MSLVLDVGDEAVIVVSPIGDMLRSSIGQQDGIRSLHVAGAVGVFGGVKAGPRVGVLDAVAIGIG
jgi:hypothetical protein